MKSLILLLSVLSALATEAAQASLVDSLSETGYNWGEAIGIAETTTNSAVRGQANLRAGSEESTTQSLREALTGTYPNCSLAIQNLADNSYSWGEAIGIAETTTDSAVRGQANQRAAESESNTEVAKQLANSCIHPNDPNSN